VTEINAHDIVIDNKKDCMEDVEVHELIRKIYDDIKKQVCSRCKDYNHGEDACYSDDVNKYREMKLNDADPTFGCNKFKPK